MENLTHGQVNRAGKTQNLENFANALHFLYELFFAEPAITRLQLQESTVSKLE